MFFQNRKVGPTELVRKLNFASVDEASESVQSFLSSLKIEKSTAIRVRLSVEETLLRWIDHFEEEPEFHLEMGMRLSHPFIVLKLWEEEFNPLAESRNDLGLWVGDLLGTIGLAPVYRYINGCNIVQFPLRRPQWNPGITLMVFTLAGSLLGIILDLLFPDAVRTMVTTTVLTPLQDAFIRVLNSVSAPVMFLSVLTTVCGVGSILSTSKSGVRLIRRFLLYSTLFTVISMFLCERCFTVSVGALSLSRREITGILDFFLEVFPGDVLSPFIAGDFTQLIVIAMVLGNAIMIGGAKVQTLYSIIDEANTAGLIIAEWIGMLSPWFVAILIILGILNNTIHMLLGIWKPALLITFFSVLALVLRLLHISLRYNVPVTRLWSKMKKSFLLSLKTFSVEASYTDNVRCCEKELGISKKLTSYSIPIGLICFMPVSTVASTILTVYCAECYHVSVSGVWMIMAVFLAVTLAAAGPPTAGIGILTYTVMFSKLHIPTSALTIVLAGDILMGFVIYPVNQAMLQLDLVLAADKQGLLKKETLRK